LILGHSGPENSTWKQAREAKLCLNMFEKYDVFFITIVVILCKVGKYNIMS